MRFYTRRIKYCALKCVLVKCFNVSSRLCQDYIKFFVKYGFVRHDNVLDHCFDIQVERVPTKASNRRGNLEFVQHLFVVSCMWGVHLPKVRVHRLVQPGIWFEGADSGGETGIGGGLI